MLFRDRVHAGQVLAEKLKKYANRPDLVILALPRGGVPVAFEVAKALNAPLDVFMVRKLGLPWQPELAMGAIASGGVRILNDDIIRAYRVPKTLVDKVASEERTELERREKEYSEASVPANGQWKSAILIDDGLATGATMLAAVLALRKIGCEHLVIAVPVSAYDTFAWFKSHVDEIVCAETPRFLGSVGSWYQNFDQTSDDEVKWLLQLSRASFSNTSALQSHA
jgi:putative phosphoribosyl transferase